MTEAKKNWAESRQLRVGAMLPTAQHRPYLRIAGEDQSGAPPGEGFYPKSVLTPRPAVITACLGGVLRFHIGTKLLERGIYGGNR
jgi:hypothetical protein